MPPPPPPAPPRVSRLGSALLTAAVAVAGVALSLVAGDAARDTVDKRVQQSFENEHERVIDDIVSRMKVVEGVLRSAQALFQASNEVERSEWHDFVTTLGPTLGEHGIVWFLYVHGVADGEVEAFRSLVEQPHGDKDAVQKQVFGLVAARHRIVMYAELGPDTGSLPMSDLAENADVRSALDLSTADDEPRLSEPCALLAGDPTPDCEVLCLPVFARGRAPATAQARNEGVVGWVCAVLRASKILEAALGGIATESEASVRDGATLIAEHVRPGAAEEPGELTVETRPANVGGREWLVELRARPDHWIAVKDKGDGLEVLLVGLAVTALCAALVWNLATTRSRALLLAYDMSQSARQALAEVEVQRDQVRAQAEELEEARDQALAAARAKSEFLATMSHEIRTPLSGVVGMTSLLRETRLTDEQKEFVGHVHASADQLLAIVNDLLDFSKAEAGRMTVEKRTFSLGALCDEALRGVRPMADAKGLPLERQVDRNAPAYVVGDALRLRQVIVNLLSNAVKFSSRGAILLEVGAKEVTESEVLLRFQVTDRGIGIEPAVLARLFEPFTQADATTTRKFGGTGLGLAICKRLVELMGGTIGAESRAGEGSTFWFELRMPVGDPGDRTTGEIG